MAADDARASCRTYLAYLTLGGERSERSGCVIVRQDATPIVYDVNHVQVPGEVDCDRVFALLEEHFGDRDFRHVVTTPFSEPRLVARLADAGFEPDPTLQGLLRGALRGPDPERVEIRRVTSESDWERFDRLARADHVESDTKRAAPVYSEAVTRQIQWLRRRVAGEVHYFLAWVGQDAVGYFSSWPGVDGLGMVEDLFTLPSHRRRGIARALIHHCVGDARVRGADAVLIGADYDDTPRRLYAAMGFEPVCFTCSWNQRLPGPDAAAASQR